MGFPNAPPFTPQHQTFPASSDAIIPITDQAYFDNDIVTRFIEFLQIAYSPDTLTENLNFIANALTLKNGESAQERIRRYFLQEFISRTWLRARNTLIWFPKYEKIYQALEAAIALLEFKQQYIAGFRQPASALFKAYASNLHSFDKAYRHFIVQSDDAHGDILKSLIEDVENLYTQWFLDELGEAWSDALGKTWELEGIPSQTKFFGRHVLPILERSDREKAFVIISDALRYEVASELQEVIKKLSSSENGQEPGFLRSSLIKYSINSKKEFLALSFLR